MQNKCNCQSGFVPVNGNWDFSMNGDCGCSGSTRRRSNNECKQCGEYESRTMRDDDCQCERCDDAREVMCCEQNTYVREMDNCRSGYDSRSGSDCECSANYTRNRSARSCGECESAYTRSRSGCGCEKENGTAYSRKNRGVGMVKGYMQEIDEIFESESALRAGTLFPELHKPLNGYCPCDENCGTCKQAAAFAAWEMRLYLNTHPNDKEALSIFRKLCKEAAEENYATTFLTDEGFTNGWSWVRNPWPWEYDCQCGERN